MSSISCLGSCGKDCGGKRGSEKTTLGPDDTEEDSTEYGKRLHMYTAMSLSHNFDNS